MRKYGPFLLVASLGTLGATHAQAFENQWHLGAGINGLSFSGDKNYLVPALSLYGAYGLSDLFDLRLETGAGVPLSSAKSASSLEYGELVFAYKLDVIEWIPWAGLGAGAFGATSSFQGAGRNAIQPAASLWFGIDYAFSREWGVGGLFALHSWVMDSTRSNLRIAATQFGLHIERRFGW